MVLIKQDLKDIIQKAEYIEGTHGTTATPTWTGTSTTINTLKKGQVIYFKMTSAGTSAGNTLNLTLADGSTTGAKQIYYHGTTTKLTTHFPVNTVLELVYDGTSWRCTAIQNTNNFERITQASQIKAGEALASGVLAWGKNDTLYYTIKPNTVYDTRYPILWIGGAISSGASSYNVYSVYNNVTLTTTKSGVSVTANEQVYIEGTSYSNGLFTVSANVFKSDSGLVEGTYYIPIGGSHSTTGIRFNCMNRNIYYCKDGELYIVNDNLSNNGGRNLIPKSQEFTGISTGTLTGETYKDCAIRRYNNTSGTTYMDCVWDLPTIGTFYPGDEYTLSFWAKGTGNIMCYSYGGSGYIGTKPIQFSNGGVSDLTGYGDGRVNFTLTDEWKRYYVTWKLNPSSNVTSNTILKKLLIRTLAGTDAYYCGVMFEEGNVPHDWSPNPNDYSKQNHTHHDTDIDWNGTNTQNSVSPLDMAMYEEFSANRLAFFNGDNITVEYSTDGGTTWTKDTSITAGNKSKITSTGGQLICGNGSTTDYSKNQLRITFDMGDVGSASILYAITRKLMIFYATAGASGSKVQISTSTYSNPTTFTNIGSAYGLQGWSGWNSIPLNITLGGMASQTGNTSVRVKCLRLTFTQTGGTGNGYVNKIKLFGESQWTVPSNLARNGHIYNYNEIQDAVFPAKVTASSFVKSGGTSSQFLKADGSVDSNTYLTSHQNITGKADKTNGVSQVTDTNANNYTNIGSLSSGATQQAINNAINTKIGTINTDVSALKSIKAIEVVATKPTASASTMNKLYIVSENNKVNVYYTKQSGSTYILEKMDEDILDELSIAWNDITGKPTIDTAPANNANNLITSKAVYDGLSGKAPNNHASNSTTYGLGTTSNYGHVKTIQNLTTDDGNGLALGAGQGKALKALIDAKPNLGTTSTTASKGDHTHSADTIGTVDDGSNIIQYYGVYDVQTLLELLHDEKVSYEDFGEHSHSYSSISNKPSYTATVTSSTSGAYKIGSINISGSNVDIYGKDTNTTYTPASASPLRLHGNAGVVGTSAKYAREDHRHPRYVKYAESNTASDGYFKLFRVTVVSWSNKPFVFKIIRRGATQEINYKLRFSNVDVSKNIPTVTSLYNTGDEFNLWVYNNQDNTFDIIVKEPETYFSCDVEFYDGMNLNVTDLQTRLTATEFNNLTASNLTKSTYIGFTSAEKTKLSGIATGANNYTHPTSYGAKTGVPTGDATLTHGGTFTVTQPVTDAMGHVTALNTRTYTLPTDNNTHNVLEQGTRINIGEAVSANSILGKVYGDSNGYYKKLVSGLQLDTSYPIFVIPTATTGATNGYQYPYHLKINVNLQTTVSGVTITANKQVFVEGTALDKNKFTVSSKVFVSEGSFTTNNYYIPIGGSAGSTTNINFNSIDSRVFRATSTTNLVPVESSLYATASHTHGSLANNGTLNSDITSLNKIVVTDSNNNLKTTNIANLGMLTRNTFVKDEVSVASTSASSVNVTILDENIIFSNKSNWTVTGEMTVIGLGVRFQIMAPGESTKKYVAVGKNSGGNLAYWWSTGDSTESSKTYSADYIVANTWYPFKISKNGQKVTFEFNNNSALTYSIDLPYFDSIELLTLNIMKYNVNGGSVRNVNLSLGDSVEVTPTKTSGIEIGKINVNGKETTLYQQDNNNTYTPASATPLVNSRVGTVGTSAKYAREDHAHPNYDYLDLKGTDNTLGYINLIKFTITASYQDKPIVIKTQHRDKIERSVIQIKFSNVNNNDPALQSITHTGQDMEFYLYKESTSNWVLICGKGHAGKYDGVYVKIDNPNSNITTSKLGTHLGTLPTSNITQSTFVGFTSAEKTKLSGIATNANNYTHPTSHATTMIIEPNALNNIGSPGAIAQANVNDAINTKFGSIDKEIENLNSKFILVEQSTGGALKVYTNGGWTYITFNGTFNIGDNIYTIQDADCRPFYNIINSKLSTGNGFATGVAIAPNGQIRHKKNNADSDITSASMYGSVFYPNVTMFDTSVSRVYYNKGSSTSGLTIGSGVDCTVEDGALKITTSTSGEKYVTYPLSLTSSNSFVFECEVAKLGTSQSVAMFVKNATTATGCWFSYENSTNKWGGGVGGSTFSNITTDILKVGDIIKIKQENGVITLYHNDKTIYSKSVTLTDTYSIGHYTNNGRIQYIKNIKVFKYNL